MSGDRCSRRKPRTSSRNACSSSVNSRRMAAAGDDRFAHVVFCSTEFNSELVQNYEYARRSLSMYKPHKTQSAKRARPPLKAAPANPIPLKPPAAKQAVVKPPAVKTDRHFVTALARGLEVLASFR